MAELKKPIPQKPVAEKAAAEEINSEGPQVERSEDADIVQNNDCLIWINSKDLQQDASASTLQEVG